MSSSRAAPRVLDAAAADDGVRGGRFAPAMSGVWAVAQGVILSFAVVLLLAVVALLGAPDAGSESVPWTAAGRVAGALWLLGHGVPITSGGATLTVVPLGIGALALFATYIGAKRSAIASPVAVATGAGTYLVLVVGAAALGGVRGAGLALAALGAVVVGGGGMVLGTLAQPEAPRVADVTEQWFGVLPPVLRLGVRGGFAAVSALTAVSGLLVVAWLVAGRATAHDVLTSLAPGWIGGVVLAVSQLALLPNLVVWATAWIAGPGFAVGEHTSFSMDGVTAGPLPALPLLGALPGPGWTGPEALWAPVVVVLCGALAGVLTWRRLEPSLVRWSDLAWVLGGIAVTAGLVTLVLQHWAGGSAGAGRLTVVGANALVVAALVAAEVLVGAAVVLVGAHTRVWERINRE